jgi:hypothetical protein
MAKTAAERMAAYRARMKAKGFKQKPVWVDYDYHFVGSKSPVDGLGRERITGNQLTRRLKEITEGMDDDSTCELFAELAVHAKWLRNRWDVLQRQMEKAMG